MKARAICLIAMVGIYAASIAAAESTRDDLQMLEGLRQRRLYSLAVDYCRQRLSDADLPMDSKAELTVQWMRLLAEQGWHLREGERQDVWDQAHQVGTSFLENHPDHPHRLLVEMQEALLWLSEGEILRQEAELDRRVELSFDRALERFREAVRRFEQLEQSLQEASLDPRQRTGRDSLTPDELHSLGVHVRLQLARVYRNRAECYPTDSADRVDAATQALQVIRDMLARTSSSDPLYWEGRVEQLVNLRLLGSADESLRLLETFRKSEPPRHLKGRIHAEAARAALAFSSPEEAQRWVELSLVPSDPGAADLDLARLEVFTTFWKTVPPEDQDVPSGWRQRTLGLAKYIGQSHGRYWGRRADHLLLQQVSGSIQSDDVEILRRQADQLYLQGEWDSAVTIYDQAADAAAEAGMTEELFRCRYRAGLVQEKRGELADAVARLQQVSREHAGLTDAAVAHFAAIRGAIQLARQDPAELARYEELLGEHVNHWPESKSASRAHLWLARCRSHRGDWEGAIEAYQRVVPSSRDWQHVIEGMEVSWRARLKESPSTENATSMETIPELDDALRSFRALEAQYEISLDNSEPPTASKHLAVIAAARLLLEFAPSRANEAEAMLSRIHPTGGSSDVPSDVSGDVDNAKEDDAKDEDDENGGRSEESGDEPSPGGATDAEIWLFLARALQPERHEAAEQLLRELDARSPQQLWQLLRQLAAATATSSDAMKKQLGKFQLELLDRLERNRELEPTLAAQLPRLRASAFVAVGDLDSALALYRQTAAEHPRDGGLQVEYARLLSESEDPAEWEEAMSRWRTVAERTPAHSDGWYEAKYMVASTLFKLNQKSDAAKLIRYLQITSPVQNSQWNRAFQQLLVACEN